MRIDRRQLVALVVVVAAAAVIVAGLLLGDGAGGRAAAANVVGLIYVEGGIVGGRSQEDLWGTTVGADDIVSLLQEAGDDPSVRAVVVRLNTPGGSAAASQEVGTEIRRLREHGKFVVASMADVAASGGYWIAANADRVVASPATITGSIGVITQLASFAELYRKLGIEVETIKSGPYKDMGDPSRPLTDTERQLLQAMVDDIFDQFVTVVSEGRNLPRDRVLAIADGRIFTGRQALELGLVDELGTFQDAIRRAAELAGIEDDYQVRELGQRHWLEDLLRRLGPIGGMLPGSPWDRGFGWIRWVLAPAQGH